MQVKPQIVVAADLEGHHNQDLDEAGNRLIKGGSWKRQRIVYIIPAGDAIAPKVYLSHCALMFPPNNQVARILAQGMEVGQAYSDTIEWVLNHPQLRDWEYILTIEHDNIPPSDGVLKLLETMEEHPEYDVVSGLYFTKGPGGCAQIWGNPSDPVLNFRPQVPIPDTVQECCGTGMGFVLWRMSMFKDETLRKPWFKTAQSVTDGLATQDLYFWMDARGKGKRCAVDTRVKVGHYDFRGDFGPADYTW